MLQALSDVSGMRLVNLSDFEPNAEAGPMLPLKISRRLTVVPLSVDGNILHLAVGYPVPHKELREVACLLGQELELGIALDATPRRLSDDDLAAADVVITMGCGDACVAKAGARREDWALEDPAGKDLPTVRRVRDEIRARVERLLASLAERPPTGHGKVSAR